MELHFKNILKRVIIKADVRRGFTLLETLVAIFIVTVAIAATMSAASSGLQSSLYAKDQITAYYLAEEAVEYVRNIRDNNYSINFSTGANGATETKTCNWLVNDATKQAQGCRTINSSCLSAYNASGAGIINCTLDAPASVTGGNTDTMTACSPNCSPLKYDSTKGYNLVSGTDSKFTRTINIETKNIQDGDASEVLVTVNMSWKSGPYAVKTFKLRESLYDWALGR